ncbi:glycosyltransferase family 2 protein [Streptomyces olivochromogenes]|uniref:glycosyltransferase family 2 protein n=1 Tax=Streptomyces olivochromogenes TaxID=1963 RepID=UPI002285919E|nr:glycosyltransferase family 2 protein [Streptomyces olivochromogenes]MCF3136172.1 glycosyltransferase family 2 protein [Streptomyces olivochromogenes]
MPGPTVSVIIAAYNAMPYLTRCITSVAEQTIGRSALEIVVVNDGSTDGTAAELERLSGLYPGLMRVFHQTNSGGPSAPRNAGLEHAQGTFVFFLDADDHLGPEALQRMVRMAEDNDTDVVLGKMVGVGGRGAPTSMFKRNQPRTDVFSSRVYWTLNPMKLFRRDLLERHRLRFPTDLAIGEDQLFVGAAYLHASGISVVADYDCLYWVLREDEGNITRRLTGSERRLRFLPRMVDLLLDKVPPGPGRDHLAHRHLTVEVQQILADQLVFESRDVQEKMLNQLAEAVEPLWHEGINDRISAMARLRLHLVRHRMLDELLNVVEFEKETNRSKTATPVLVDQGRALARYPYLRDPGRAVPDICYDVTAQLGLRHHITRAEMHGTTLHLAGHAYIHRVETQDVTTELVLRERDSAIEYRLPVTHIATPGLGKDVDQGRFSYDLAGFEATVDVTTAADGRPLGDGLWDISLAVGAQSLSKEVRIGSKRSAEVSGTASTRVVTIEDGLRALTLYTTKPYGNFTLDLGEAKHKVLPLLSPDEVRRAEDAPTELELAGRCTLTAYPDGVLNAVLTDGQGASMTFPARQTAAADGHFTVRIPVTELTIGDWSGELRLGQWTWALPPIPRNLTPVKWRRRGLPWYAKPAPGSRDRFALHVAKTDLVKAFTSRLK